MTPHTPGQGDVWWAEMEDKRRPVLVVTGTEALGHLNRVIVAPITRTVRGIPTEVRIDPEIGLSSESAASFDNLTVWPIGLLTRRVGAIPLARTKICTALAAVADG